MNVDLNVFRFTLIGVNDTTEPILGKSAELGVPNNEAHTILNLARDFERKLVIVETKWTIPLETLKMFDPNNDVYIFINRTTYGIVDDVDLNDKVNLTECVVSHFGRVAIYLFYHVGKLNFSGKPIQLETPSFAKAILLVEDAKEL